MTLSERCAALDVKAVFWALPDPARVALVQVLDEWQAEVEAKFTELEARIAQLEALAGIERDG